MKDKLIFKILAVVVLTLGVLSIGFFAGTKIAQKNTPKESVANNTSAPTPTSVSNQTVSGASKSAFDLGEIVTNLADQGGKRFVKTKVSLGYDAKGLDEELKVKKDILKSEVTSILRSKKADQLSDQKVIDELKKEIISKVNPMLTKGQVNNVYFPDLVIQY